MKILIESAYCSGHGRCYGLRPDLISCDDDGYPTTRDQPLDAGPEDDAVRLIRSCPEGAIRVAPCRRAVVAPALPPDSPA